MHYDRFQSLCSRFSSVRVGVIGDHCLDAYWTLDEGVRDLSVESGKPTHSVLVQEYLPGGASNVANSVSAVGVGEVHPFGVIGKDPFAGEMLRAFSGGNYRTSGMILDAVGWQTSVYGKPILRGVEQERLDFGRGNRLSSETCNRLAQSLRATLPGLDGVIANQQFRSGVMTCEMISAIDKLAGENPHKLFAVNSRDHTALFSNFLIWVNACEAGRLFGRDYDRTEAPTREVVEEYALGIFERTNRPVVITRGANGMLGYDGDVYDVPGIQIDGPVDSCGAGDTGLAALMVSLCAGAEFGEALEIANCAAAVTVRKLNQTGCATQAEILELLCPCVDAVTGE